MFKNRLNFPLIALALLVLSCTQAQSHESNSVNSNSEAAHSEMPAWVDLFDPKALIGEPKLVDCVLSGGAKSRCVALTVPVAPTTIKIGPWCPRNIADGHENSGIWLESGKAYDVDGEFIKNLATFYDDASWQMFDQATGDINVTDSKASCQAAARPDVDEEFQNHCVECQLSYLDEGKSQTYVIPVSAVANERLEPRLGRSGVGLALSGIRLDSPAPTHAILAAKTLAPFDDCGGHVNLHVGYHMHAVTDCLHEVESIDSEHAPMIGVALDGYAIHTRLDKNNAEPADLDACRGHTSSGSSYHYHVDQAGANSIIGCHTGQTGCTLGDESASCDASAGQRRGPPRGGRPSFQNKPLERKGD